MSQNPPTGGHSSFPRRDLLKVGAAGLGLLAVGACAPRDPNGSRRREGTFAAPDLGPAPEHPMAAPPLDLIRVGFVGVGGMGGAHVRNFLGLEGVEIVALCDINDARNREVAG